MSKPTKNNAAEQLAAAAAAIAEDERHCDEILKKRAALDKLDAGFVEQSIRLDGELGAIEARAPALQARLAQARVMAGQEKEAALETARIGMRQEFDTRTDNIVKHALAGRPLFVAYSEALSRGAALGISPLPHQAIPTLYFAGLEALIQHMKVHAPQFLGLPARRSVKEVDAYVQREYVKARGEFSEHIRFKGASRRGELLAEAGGLEAWLQNIGIAEPGLLALVPLPE
ncbi:MAG: hypothetical protein NTY23_11355 [Chloroflexi bacterium]|nr:hypothetical protein [Chloroflexota bacterium]